MNAWCPRMAVTFLAMCTLSVAVWAGKANEPSQGKEVSERKMAELTGFDGVNIEGFWNIKITGGEAWQVSLDYPEAMEEYIQAYVMDGHLFLKNKESTPGERQSRTVRADIVMPALDHVAFSGGGSLALSGFKGGQLDLRSAGEIRMEGTEGRFEALKIGIAGQSHLDMQGIAVTNADVNMAGESAVILSMEGGTLSGSIAGDGTIAYHGEIARQNVRIAGSGEVNKVE